MSKTSDIIDPVIEELLLGITDTVTENNTAPNISTMNEQTETSKIELDVLIHQLQEEKRQIQNQINEIEETKEINTEKTIHLRNLRAKKREVTSNLSEALVKKSETEYEEEYDKKQQEKKHKTESEVDSIFGITTDTLKPGEDNKQEFARNFNMFGKYKESINELRSQINQLMKRDTSEMPQQLIDERDLHVQAKISTMKTIAKEYEKHYRNLTMVGEEKQIR